MSPAAMTACSLRGTAVGGGLCFLRVFIGKKPPGPYILGLSNTICPSQTSPKWLNDTKARRL